MYALELKILSIGKSSCQTKQSLDWPYSFFEVVRINMLQRLFFSSKMHRRITHIVFRGLGVGGSRMVGDEFPPEGAATHKHPCWYLNI